MFGKESSERTCAAMESRLIEYLDGRARPAERRAIEEHLAGCEACRARVEGFNAVWSALDDLPEISPSSGFDAALRARIAAEPARRSFWNWLPAPRLAFAVTSLVILSVWFSSHPRVATPRLEAVHTRPSIETQAESEFKMIRDLPVLENFDVVSKFDALSELPVSPTASSNEVLPETR
jgi:anti-sigma factor RsiW